jgi:hypothetical protein
MSKHKREIQADIRMECYLHLHHCWGCNDTWARCYQPDCSLSEEELEVWRCDSCQAAQQEWQESL